MAINHTPRCLILSTYTPFAPIDTMTKDIAVALTGHGFQVTTYVGGNYGNPKLLEAMMLAVGMSEAPAFVFDMNARANMQVVNPTVGNQSLFDAWKLPRFSWVIDLLIHHTDTLARAPDFSLTGCVDGDDPGWIDGAGPGGRGVMHLPHGGPPPVTPMPTTAEREIDLLFVGNIRPVPAFRDWLNEASGGDPALAGILDRTVERCMTTDIGILDALGTEAAAAGRADMALDRRIALAGAVETYVRNRRRIDLLNGLKTVPVTVFGEIDPEALDHAGDNLRRFEPVSYLDVLDRMRSARLVLNVSPSLRNGGHERIFYGLAHGAHVLTDPSRFLVEEAERGLGISFTPYDATEIDAFVAELLAVPDDAADAMRETATAHYAARHSWTERTRGLLAAIRKAFPESGL